MRIPQNLSEQYRVIREAGIDVTALYEAVFSTTPVEKTLRMCAGPMLNMLPTRFRYFITDIAKRLRNPSRGLKVVYPLDFDENRKVAASLKGVGHRPWWNKRAVVCLSHDVDNDEGYAFVRGIADIDREAGIPSTFNFLTHDNYALHGHLLRTLADEGFETGLHGYTHDQGASFRRPATIRKRLDAAMSRLEGYGVMGARTPALSRGPRYFELLGEFGILYDSSLQVGSAIYPSVRLPYPFYLERFGLWELPLMVQDDNYLRDATCSEDEMLNSIRRFIRETVELNGMCVINFHPHLMASRVNLYRRAVGMMKEFENDVVFKTTGDVYALVSGNFVDA